MKKSQKNLILPIASILTLSVIAVLLINLNFAKSMISNKMSQPPAKTAQHIPEITKTESEWKQILNSKQYYILREKGTDPAYSETLILNEKRPGTYVTADCNEPVFRSENKYDSKTGWPSFWKPIDGSVAEVDDNTFGMKRIEVVGKKCGGHLGHIFNDGPEPTGLRYCINPSALKFIPDPV